MNNNLHERLKNLNVLFVDDDIYVIDIMKEILPYLFNRSFYAADGVEGLSIFKNNHIDIILTDLHMPNMNGIKMTQEIKTINKNIKTI
ncbi:MAG: response regulator [Campylobacterota bacterium]|nr:response regulator [Campylobacterota bacterium]